MLLESKYGAHLPTDRESSLSFQYLGDTPNNSMSDEFDEFDKFDKLGRFDRSIGWPD